MEGWVRQITNRINIQEDIANLKEYLETDVRSQEAEHFYFTISD